MNVEDWFEGMEDPDPLPSEGTTHAVYKALLDKLAATLIKDGKSQIVALPKGYPKNSLSSFRSEYQRDHLHCFESGWRFKIKGKPDTSDGRSRVSISKVSATLNDRDKYQGRSKKK